MDRMRSLFGAAALALLATAACGDDAPAGTGASSSSGDDADADATSSSSGEAIDADATSSSSSSSSGEAIDAALEAGSDDAGDDAATPGETVHFIGRFDTSEALGPRFEWPGSGLVATFHGSGIEARFAGTAQLQVVLDGTPLPERVRLEDDPGSAVVLATGLPIADHEVRIYRRDESLLGTAQFQGFSVLDGELVGTPDPITRRIEFIGDSITCGYGNEGVAPCNFSAETENEYLAFGAVTARALHAEHTAIAWSGKGMVRNYGGEVSATMPQLYDRTLPLANVGPWDRSTWVPDAIVINLGTNDYSTGTDPGDAYTTTYTEFLATLRGYYPNAHLFAFLASFSSGARARVQSAVASRNDAGDTKVHYVEHTIGAGYNGGCDGHPTVAAHAAMASTLVPALGAALGW